MATFHVIRYNRTFMNSDMFAHIPAGDPTDTPLAIAGTYQGHSGPKAAFGEALLMTSRKADKLIKALVRQGFPADMMDKVSIEVDEPAAPGDGGSRAAVGGKPPVRPQPQGVPGHSGYGIVATSPGNDGVRCECGWTSEGYHDMTSYAHHDWLRHVAGVRTPG